MLPRDFYHEYTYGDFIRRAHYFFKDKDEDARTSWEQMRYAATLPLSLQAKNANKEALLSFPWDKKPPTKKAAPLTKKTIDGLLSQYKFLNKRQWN